MIQQLHARLFDIDGRQGRRADRLPRLPPPSPSTIIERHEDVRLYRHDEYCPEGT